MTPEQIRLRAQHAALTRWSKEDPKEQGKLGQDGLRRRFEAQVDPDGTLPEAERQRRAEAARRAHMKGLALKSSRARSRAKSAAQLAEAARQAEAEAAAAEAEEAEFAGEDAAS